MVVPVYRWTPDAFAQTRPFTRTRRCRSRLPEPDAVVGPERLGVHQRPGHPRFVTGQRGDLERLRRNPQRRPAKAQVAGPLEAPLAVIVRRSLKEDQRRWEVPGGGERVPD